MDRPYGIRCDGLRGYCFRDSKIHDLYSAVGGYHHILRLNIPVNNTVHMCFTDTIYDLYCNVDCLNNFQLSLFLNIFF